MRKTLIFLGMLLGALPAGAAESAYSALVREDAPVAYWRFEGTDTGLERAGEYVFPGMGPRAPKFPLFSDGNLAMRFDGERKGSALKAEGARSDFQFRNGDAITLEAWVDLESEGIAKGENLYIVGKGRTGNDGFARENQNYALRLFGGGGGEARLSFLFRSSGKDGEFHRWTSSTGFLHGSGWHHVAVTYRFGDDKSVRGYIDGAEVKGKWDFGGATKREPVVDEDEIWIGSSRGRSLSNSFKGQIDEVAIYRKALSKSRVAGRYRFAEEPPVFPSDRVPEGKVFVEVYEGVGSHKRWPREVAEPTETYLEEAFGFFRLNPKYAPGGWRTDRESPFFIRAYTEAILPEATEELLLRSRTGSRVWMERADAKTGVKGFEVVASTPFLIKGSDGHGPVAPLSPPGGLKPARMGDREITVALEGDGVKHRFIWEMLINGTAFRPEMGEAVVAVGGGRDFHLVSPGSEVPLTDEGWREYAERRRAAHAQEDAQRRRAAAAVEDPFWAKRHERAREFVGDRSRVPVPESPEGYPVQNEIDRFLALRMSEAAGEAGAADPDTVHFGRDIKPILADKCFRCHGEKEKGGLKLDDRERVLAGGESGDPALVPGDPEESLLLSLVRDPGDDRMPPKGEGLSEGEIGKLETWIADGAEWSAGGDVPELTPLTSDLAFLRRVYLDVVGVPPSLTEIAAFEADDKPGARARVIDRLLEDPRWADHWVGYWQDVLAENPSILKPTLNNTGPFRWWIYEAFLDNKPMDRFVTELITMPGSPYGGGPAGFGLATQNDVPMAAKAHIVGTAFLGVEMKCARCHDAPYHSATQRDLFQLAAMLQQKPLKVPESSSVPASFFSGRKSLITVSLDPGESIEPDWPFAEFGGEELDEVLMQRPDNPRHRLAALVTRPENERFAKVVVNRLWKRYFGLGIVEPAHDWEGNDPSHPELLDRLAREFAANGYDLKHVSRLILGSHAYQRESRESRVVTPEERFFAAPERRRLTAEQVVDSYYATAGREIDTEELNFDVEGYRPASAFINLGKPTRAWQFCSLSNERDRPSLALPKAQAVIDVLEAFGWRPSRSEPVTDRESDPNIIQPGVLANGTMGTWLTKLTDASAMTALALEERSLNELIDVVFLRLQTRRPTAEERAYFFELLEDGYDSRVVPGFELPEAKPRPRVRQVAWSNHLNAEANTVKLEMERAARAGEPATLRLRRDWRERMEDALWAIMNSPETMFVP